MKFWFLLLFIPGIAGAWPSQQNPDTPQKIQRNFNDIFDAFNKRTIAVSSVAANFVVFTASNAWQNYISISLSPGEWDLSCGYIFNTAGSADTTSMRVAISSFSGNTTTDHTIGDNEMDWNFSFSANYLAPIDVEPYTIKIASTTVFYLKGYSIWQTGSPLMRYGHLRARKMK